MKLYLLTQDDNSSWDSFDSCLVCAENEEDAKSIMPDFNEGKPFEPSRKYGTWAFTIEGVRCKEIGIANLDVKRGVVINSFNAG